MGYTLDNVYPMSKVTLINSVPLSTNPELGRTRSVSVLFFPLFRSLLYNRMDDRCSILLSGMKFNYLAFVIKH